MAISKSDQALLNKFPDTQPALRRSSSTLIPDKSGVPLGDMILEGTGMGCKMVSWSFASQGGAVSTIVLGRDIIPVGSIISTIIVEVITGVTAGVANIQLTNSTGGGAITLLNIPNTDWAAAGFKNYMASPAKATSVLDNIAINFTTAATAGAANIYISYMNPVQA
jgi:hypothetical protein